MVIFFIFGLKLKKNISFLTFIFLLNCLQISASMNMQRDMIAYLKMLNGFEKIESQKKNFFETFQNKFF